MAAMSAAVSQPGDSLPKFDALWNYRDLPATEAAFRALLPRAEASGDRSYHAQLLTQIARTYSLRDRFDECHALLDTVVSMLGAEQNLARVRLLLERGRAFNSSGRPDTALGFFHDAAALAHTLNERRFEIDALHMIAIAVPDARDKVEWNLKGIALAETDPPDRGWLSALYNNIGEAYASLREFENAKGYFQRLVDLYLAAGKEPDMYTVKDVARMWRMLEKPDSSLALMEPVMRSLQQRGDDNGWIREELAESLHMLGRDEEAHPHFVKAYELLSVDPNCLKFEREKLDRLKQMSGSGSQLSGPRH